MFTLKSFTHFEIFIACLLGGQPFLSVQVLGIPAQALPLGRQNGCCEHGRKKGRRPFQKGIDIVSVS